MTIRVFFLGGGNMAAAIAGGLIRQGGYGIHVAERGLEKRECLAAELGVTVSETLPHLEGRDVLVLAVKPQDMENACANVRTGGALVLSVAAGLSVGTLSRYLGGTRRIVRVMPNTPSKIGLGVSGLFAADGADEADRQTAERIMQAAGQTVWLENEDQMHSVTGISGSGPAYVFYLLNALQTAAEQQGFDSSDARRLSLATFKGAVALAEQSGEAFSLLQQQVTSKGGTTREAIKTFEANHVAESIGQGVQACVNRSRQLAEEYEAV